MSLTVIAIGAIHGIVPFVTAAITESRAKTWFSIVVMTAIAFMMGNPIFIGTDLFFLVIGSFFALKGLKSVSRPTPAPTKPTPVVAQERPEADHGWLLWLLAPVVIFVGVFFVVIQINSKSSERANTLAPSTSIAPQQLPTPTQQKANTAPPTSSKPNAKNKNIAEQHQTERANATLQDLRENCKPPSCRIVK